ncbi:MAG: hypothetical protein DRO67_05110, partial [Candidatus Asgardarchaeum californiense]
EDNIIDLLSEKERMLSIELREEYIKRFGEISQTTFRKHIWEEFLNGSDIIVYVVDSADKERLDLATEEFWRVVNLSSLKGIPVLVLANKQDLPDALDAGEIAAKMKLFQLRNRSFAVYPISALKGEGIEEAFKWVADRFK